MTSISAKVSKVHCSEGHGPRNNLISSAARYEIRGYSGRSLHSNSKKLETKDGIAVPDSLLPKPLKYGTVQEVTIDIPWPNEVFYYAIVSIDEVKL